MSAVGSCVIALLGVAALRSGAAASSAGPATGAARGRGGVTNAPPALGRRERRVVRQSLPGVAEGVARRLRSGVALRTAFELTVADARGALRDDLRRVDAGVAAGESFAAALQRWAAERRLAEIDHFVAVATLGATVGGELVPAFEATAAALRDDLGVADEVRALTAQSRASTVVLGILPVVAALGMATIEPASAAFLLASRPGLTCLAAAVCAEVIGLVWMRALVRGVR